MHVSVVSYGCVVGMLEDRVAHILSNDSEHMNALVFSVQWFEESDHSLHGTRM